MVDYKKKYLKYKEKYSKLKIKLQYSGSDDEKLSKAIAMSLEDEELSRTIIAMSLKDSGSDDEELSRAVAMSLEKKQKSAMNIIDELPYLFDLNPNLIDEEPDGNCLFRTFARILYNNPEKHFLVRTNICLYLLNNNNEWANFIDNTLSDDYDYISKMMEDYTWGGHIEIMGFRNLYGCIIVIHDPPNPPITENPNNIIENTLSIDDINNGKRLLENKILHIFRKNNHYQTLKFDNSDYTKKFN